MAGKERSYDESACWIKSRGCMLAKHRTEWAMVFIASCEKTTPQHNQAPEFLKHQHCQMLIHGDVFCEKHIHELVEYLFNTNHSTITIQQVTF